MDAFKSLSSVFWTVGDIFGYLGDTSGKIPLIGGWCQLKFYEVSDSMYSAAVHLNALDSWGQLVDLALDRVLSWDTIRSYILGAWTWLDTIDDRIVARARSVWTWLDTIDDRIVARARATWTWLDAIDDRIVNLVRSRWAWLEDIRSKVYGSALSYWSWLNTIDDKIVDRARSTWTWLDSIDDRIKDVAWNHVRDQLSTWIWDFLLAEAGFVARTGYRILSYLWNLEWDDDNKEVKS